MAIIYKMSKVNNIVHGKNVRVKNIQCLKLKVFVVNVFKIKCVLSKNVNFTQN